MKPRRRATQRAPRKQPPGADGAGRRCGGCLLFVVIATICVLVWASTNQSGGAGAALIESIKQRHASLRGDAQPAGFVTGSAAEKEAATFVSTIPSFSLSAGSGSDDGESAAAEVATGGSGGEDPGEDREGEGQFGVPRDPVDEQPMKADEGSARGSRMATVGGRMGAGRGNERPIATASDLEPSAAKALEDAASAAAAAAAAAAGGGSGGEAEDEEAGEAVTAVVKGAAGAAGGAEADEETAEEGKRAETGRQKREKPPRVGPNAKWGPVNGSFVIDLGKPKHRPLMVTLSRKSMKHVFLDATRFGKEGADKVDPPLEVTRGTLCPEFEHSYENYPGIASCWHGPPLEDVVQVPASQPVNCASLKPSCVQDMDFQPHEQWSAQVLVLHNVYVNVAGQVFNRTHLFDDNSCAADRPFHYASGPTTTVHRYRHLVSLVDWFAWSPRSFLLDVLPMFVSLDAVLPAMKRVPVAFGHRQQHALSQAQQMSAYGSTELLGVRLEKLNAHVLKEGDLFFADRLVLPLRQRCGRPSKAVWGYLRSRHLLPKAGLPMYRHDAEFRSTFRKWKAEKVTGVGADWVVVLGVRDERKPLVETLKLQQQMLKYVPAQRIVLYKEGSLSFTARKALLNRARVLVAVHGNILADMVFMPPGGAVLEIRPRRDGEAIFHQLADACGLAYYLTLAEGRAGPMGRTAAGKPSVRDPKQVHRLLAMVAKKALANLPTS
ncbi:hypothetical protein CLOM_g16907 [Closterium sp. NIES-68]|nr:hypothetical protein CLOM_g16907 [Closterium sp. NIES-68]GJP81469.1 hypothetical protein CLOP_g11613 [Closterium sp. NIES-67]